MRYLIVNNKVFLIAIVQLSLELETGYLPCLPIVCFEFLIFRHCCNLITDEVVTVIEINFYSNLNTDIIRF